MSMLLDLVVCPACRSALASESAQLRCTGCKDAYRLDGDVPVLMQDKDSERRPSRLVRLQYEIMGNPRLYDFHQAHGGGRSIAAQVRQQLQGIRGSTMLDIGAGTGMLAGLLPPETRYVWFDNDALKLRGFLSKRIDSDAVLGDLRRLPFRDESAEWSAMVEVSHHLADGAFDDGLGEAARVTRDRFIFVDALRGLRLRSRALWQLDLGRFPRSQDELVSALSAHFELERVERFRVNHDHILCLCVPKRGRR